MDTHTATTAQNAVTADIIVKDDPIKANGHGVVSLEAHTSPPPKRPTATPSKTPRRNYNTVHARPLPLTIHPLPALIPHNPLSLIYLTVAFVRQLFFPPTSHQRVYKGYFSPETRSVHITDEDSIRGLWENGFFGKGTLSRSEPTWLDRERRRLGIIVEETAEDITARRRTERKAFKIERAKREREERERQHREGIKGLASEETDKPELADGTTSAEATDKEMTTPPVVIEKAPHATKQQVPGMQETSSPITATPPATPPDATALINQEHLQLELVEAFFLVYALGVLKIYDPTTHQTIPTDQFLNLCLAHSHFPPLRLPLHFPDPQPDNPFFLSYVAYHHFRSLGWVVRNGVKFGADFLLYNRGPVFAHAEFAVLVIPSYTDPFWGIEEGRTLYKVPAPKPWHWLHMVNRVQAQVVKTLVLCFVSVPAPWNWSGGEVDVGKLLKRYEVREVVLKRWVPNRNRD